MFKIPRRKIKLKAWATMASPKKTTTCAFPIQKLAKKQIREQEYIDYDKEIKSPKIVGGQKLYALTQMDCDDPIIPKNSRDPNQAWDLPQKGPGICLDPYSQESQSEEIGS